MTAKYGLPYFANFVNSDMSPDDARSMCCRLRLDNRELRKRAVDFLRPIRLRLNWSGDNQSAAGWLFIRIERRIN